MQSNFLSLKPTHLALTLYPYIYLKLGYTPKSGGSLFQPRVPNFNLEILFVFETDPANIHIFWGITKKLSLPYLKNFQFPLFCREIHTHKNLFFAGRYCFQQWIRGAAKNAHCRSGTPCGRHFVAKTPSKWGCLRLCSKDTRCHRWVWIIIIFIILHSR